MRELMLLVSAIKDSSLRSLYERWLQCAASISSTIDAAESLVLWNHFNGN
jgi:hypothetical protein